MGIRASYRALVVVAMLFVILAATPQPGDGAMQRACHHAAQ
jgi:hypothetical protein